MEAKGIVSDIQRFSLHDGPGIRTTVFLKGCNLRCRWCHNPETRKPGPQLQYIRALCVGCGSCAAACPHGALRMSSGNRVVPDRRVCIACGTCSDECPTGALTIVGREMTARDVVEAVLRDREFYRTSGGGVTISGGEPLYQDEFAREILRLSREADIHAAIETNLSCPREVLANVLPHLDLVIADVKLVDAERHRRWTGASSRRVLKNLAMLRGEKVRVIVRTPVVASVNDDAETISGIGQHLAGFPNLDYYELLPYNQLGDGKYASLGMRRPSAKFERPASSTMEALAAIVKESGIHVRIAGEDHGGE